jgi:cytochrome c biogenesis factor
METPDPGTTLKIPWFPSGYLIGGLLLVNLIAAHLARFKFSWKKAGILVLHSGVILLLLGQLFTGLFQVESRLRLDQGETKNYSVSYYHDELAVIDTSASDSDQVISVPDSQLYKGHRAFNMLVTFIASQLVVMTLGMLPLKYWRGIQARRNELSAHPLRTVTST